MKRLPLVSFIIISAIIAANLAVAETDPVLAKPRVDTSKYVYVPFDVSLFPGLSIGSLKADGQKIEHKYAFNIIAGRADRMMKGEFGTVLNWVSETANGWQVVGGWNHAGSMNGLQFSGLGNSVSNSLNGLQFAGGLNVVGDEVNGLQGVGGLNIVGGDINGLTGSGLGNIVGGEVNGLVGAGLGNIVGGDINGLVGSGICNINGGEMNGLSGSGLFNVTGGEVNGLVGSSLFNLNGDDFSGLAGAAGFNLTGGNADGMFGAGGFNIVGGDVNGLQFATFNYAKTINGMQVGLLNYSNEANGALVGAVSISKKHGVRWEAMIDEAGQTYAVLHSGNRDTYNRLAIGGKDGGKYKTTSIGAGFGRRYKPKHGYQLENGLAIYYVNYDPKATSNAEAIIYKTVTTMTLKLSDNVAIVVGPTLNFYVSKVHDGTDLEGYTFWSTERPGNYRRFYLGGMVALRLFGSDSQ